MDKIDKIEKTDKIVNRGKVDKTLTGMEFNQVYEKRVQNLRNIKMQELQADFLLRTSWDHIILDLNQKAYEILGITPDIGIIGRHLSELLQKNTKAVLDEVMQQKIVNLLIHFDLKSKMLWWKAMPFLVDGLPEEIWLVGKSQLVIEAEEAELEIEELVSNRNESSVVKEKVFYLDERFQLRKMSTPLLIALSYKEEISDALAPGSILVDAEKFLVEAKIAKGKAIDWIIFDQNGRKFDAVLKVIDHENMKPFRYEIGVKKMEEHKSQSNGKSNGVNAKLQEMIMTFPVACFLLDINRKVKFFNQKAAFLSYRSGEKFIARVADVSHDDYEKILISVLEYGKVIRPDFFFELKDGVSQQTICFKKLKDGDLLAVLLPACDSLQEDTLKELEKIEDELIESKQTVNDLEKENNDLESRYEILQKTMSGQQIEQTEKIESLKASLESSNGEKLLLQSDLVSLKKEMAKQDEDLLEIEQRAKEVQLLMDEMKQEQAESEKRKNDFQERIKLLLEKKESQANDLNELYLKIKAKDVEAISLKEKNHHLNSLLNEEYKKNKQLLEKFTLSEKENEKLREELAEVALVPAIVDVGLENSLSFLTEVAVRMTDIHALLSKNKDDKEALALLGKYSHFLTQFADIHEGDLEEVDLIKYSQGLQLRFIEEFPEELNFFLSFGRKLKAINVNPDQLSLVIDQLMDNAREAIVPKGDNGEIKLMLRNKIVQDHEKIPTGEYMLIRVADNGDGFKENEDQALNQFFTKKEQHCGLGLTLVKYLVEKWNGYIELSSDNGAVVDIYLPVQNPEFEEEEKLEDDSLEVEAIVTPFETEKLEEGNKSEKTGISSKEGEVAEIVEENDGKRNETKVSQKPIYLSFFVVNDKYQKNLSQKLREAGYNLVEDISLAEVMILDIEEISTPKILEAMKSMALNIWIVESEKIKFIEGIMKEKGLFSNLGHKIFEEEKGIEALISFIKAFVD